MQAYVASAKTVKTCAPTLMRVGYKVSASSPCRRSEIVGEGDCGDERDGILMLNV